jgi:hypothetical protein
MDSERLRVLQETSVEHQLQPWVKELIEDFVSGKEPTMEAPLLDEKEFGDTLAFLQLETFTGDKLLGYHIQNTESRREIDTVEMVSFPVPDEATVAGFIENIADMQGGEDSPNDFQLSFALRYDDETAVIIGKTMEECPLHCDACAANMDGFDENRIGISKDYSCSHMDGEYNYISTYRIGMMHLNEFEDRPDWATPYEIEALATDYRIEAKSGIENGSFELQEAEVGDVIQLVGNDKKDGQYTYEFTIVSAGTQPTATLVQLSPDGSRIEQKDTKVYIVGSGQWTNWRNNPMVKGVDEQMAINYGHIYEGGFVMVRDAASHELYQLLPAIQSIEIFRFDRAEEHAA